MTVIQTVISVIRQRHRSAEEYEIALDDFAEQTNRLRNLVEDLLYLAREDTSAGFVLRPVDLSNLLIDVSDSVSLLAETKGLRLSCDVPAGIQMIGDSDNLIRLFMNLIDNTIKYTNSGTITVCITVSDTGNGIDLEHLPHVFDRFYRTDLSRTAKGNGIGLSISQVIVESHHGILKVESQTSWGSNCIIRFPLTTNERLSP